MARDHAKLHTDFQVVGAYLSPVSDEYKKPGLAPAPHRFNMCSLACKRESDWLMVDPWEVVQKGYSKTADVLDHFRTEINTKIGGVEVIDAQGNTLAERRPVRIMLLAGSDLIQTMSEPDVWDVKDVSEAIFAFIPVLSTLACSFITSSATLAASSSNAPSQKLTSPSSLQALSTHAVLWRCTLKTSTWSLSWFATTCRQQKFACSYASPCQSCT